MPIGVRLRVWGEYACFTRPEMKVERVSYDVITPSTARGILEAVYWKPEIRWRITHLHVLKPIRFASLRRNEVASKIPANSVARVMRHGTGYLGLHVETDRQQRAATLLDDVDYVIEGRFDIVGGDPNPAKHLDQFSRRARGGQCFHRPYLGCREFPADFALVEPDEPIPRGYYSTQGEHDLGWMLDDIEYLADETGPVIDSNGGRRWRAEPRFVAVRMVRGVIDLELCRPEART